MNSTRMYSPEQVAEMLQLSKNTVYNLISRGEIIAKRIGKVYRIPRRSIEFIFSGLDADLADAQNEDQKSLKQVQKELQKARASL